MWGFKKPDNWICEVCGKMAKILVVGNANLPHEPIKDKFICIECHKNGISLQQERTNVLDGKRIPPTREIP